MQKRTKGKHRNGRATALAARTRDQGELNLVHGLIFTSLAVGWIPSRAAVIVAADQTQKNNGHRR